VSKFKNRSVIGLVGIFGATLALLGGSVLSAGAASSPLATAKSQLTQEMKVPKGIALTIPLKHTPPKGKTVVFLQCDESQCAFQGNGIKAAAAAVGWTEKTVDWQETNPATFVAAANTALQYHPVAVFFSGEPYAVWSSVIPAYQAAGAIIVPSAEAAQPHNKVVVADIAGLSFSAVEAKELANYVAVSSKGKANILFVTVPAFPPFPPLQKDFQNDIATVCPACTTNVLSVTITQLFANQVDSTVVSALQKAPSTTYIVSVDGTFITGLTSALTAAGLGGKFQIASASAGPTDMQNVQTGTEAMTESTGGFVYGGWEDVDTALRHVEGMPITIESTEGAGWVPVVFTKSNVPTPSSDENYPSNYPQLFKKLWKVK
jgi:ribose transport system substrate-binding protein